MARPPRKELITIDVETSVIPTSIEITEMRTTSYKRLANPVENMMQKIIKWSESNCLNSFILLVKMKAENLKFSCFHTIGIFVIVVFLEFNDLFKEMIAFFTWDSLPQLKISTEILLCSGQVWRIKCDCDNKRQNVAAFGDLNLCDVCFTTVNFASFAAFSIAFFTSPWEDKSFFSFVSNTAK